MNQPKPNILFILVDDMGYGDFSAFNHGLSSTPTLDDLMRESLCLTQHYTASPVCNPSRAALLTGRYPHRTGSIDTLEWRGLERLALRETTLADVFQKEPLHSQDCEFGSLTNIYALPLSGNDEIGQFELHLPQAWM